MLVSFCDFFLNGGQNAAMWLHQVLLQNWQECSKISQNACADAFGQTQTYDWLKRFKNGQTSVDEERPGNLQSAQHRKMLQKYVRLSARTVGERLKMLATTSDCHMGHASTF